jgi:hypothetical protein
MNDVTYEDTPDKENNTAPDRETENNIDMVDMSLILSQATKGNTNKPNTQSSHTTNPATQNLLPPQTPKENNPTAHPHAPTSSLARAIETDGNTDAAYCSDVQLAENANNSDKPTTPTPAPPKNTASTITTTTNSNLRAINEQIAQITLTHNQKTHNKKDNKHTATSKAHTPKSILRNSKTTETKETKYDGMETDTLSSSSDDEDDQPNRIDSDAEETLNQDKNDENTNQHRNEPEQDKETERYK